jgi:hypothetical protein
MRPEAIDAPPAERTPMNIGLISINMYTKGLNYACPVHTFAFQQFLLSHGIENTVIDYKPNYYGNFESRYPGAYYEKLAERQEKLLKEADAETRPFHEEKLKKFRSKAAGYNALAQEHARRYDKFWEFINEHYVKTDTEYDSDTLEVVDPGFDCYMCVTDVIWKYQDVEGFDRGYFLASSAMENKWKIAYAASRGVPKPFTEEQSELFFHYLEDIDIISVREKSLQEYIESHSDHKAPMVMDPVLLNDRSVYEKVTVTPDEGDYILLYYAEEQSKNAMEKAVELARKTNLPIVETTNLPIAGGMLKDRTDVEHAFRYDIGPAEWLGYIQHARHVVTNSFHAACFSIIFEKDFFIGSRNGDKIANLLRSVGLSQRDLSNPNAHDNPIDYVEVKRVLKEQTDASAAFILDVIKSLEGSVKEPHDYAAFKKSLRYPLAYNSSAKNPAITSSYPENEGATKALPSGSLEFTPHNELVTNDGKSHFGPNRFHFPGHYFVGWQLRIKIDNHWFWYMADGSLAARKGFDKERIGDRKVFGETDIIPFIPVNHIAYAVAEATWKVPLHVRIQKKIRSLLKGRA